ncbi:Dak phosphatase [Sphaerulina musiva SO2202]|uniref:Dak phosphatase n=1 Tax=Sphaerulina musiva (strain SO2202) TaxID=692275 RepID=M3CJ00_SPHMS|nr:Dak phosphatase [Sphaerulina musiva SO2202]EMF13778.1 Dak phosphatase [Sphaerulina musiva SO2202]
MAIVVEQTLPFPSSTLDLENATRWTTLLPLIRPSLKTVRTPEGQDLVVNTARAAGNHVDIIAIGTGGNLSSKVLDSKHVTAIIITQHMGASAIRAADLPRVLESAGIQCPRGVVVVRAGKQRRLDVHQSDVLEFQTNGELEQDHVLQLLRTATETTRSDVRNISDMLQAFAAEAVTTNSKFHAVKTDGGPAVLHHDGVQVFEKAKNAVERDLKHLFQQLSPQSEDIVYSVHYSDVNGLSRLENYIIANDIASYLDCQEVRYTLSHSTILNHTDHARGFSMSVCPLPSHFIAAKPKPKAHQPIGATSGTTKTTKSLSPTTPKIVFEDASIRNRIENGCNAVINEELVITEYDTIVGDGDCGYTLRDGAKKVLSFIADKDLGQLPATLADLVAELEVNMGGTSGALYCIFLTALVSSLASEDSVAKALKQALEELCQYTNARVGDRTMMDALIPFVDTLVMEGDVELATAKAKQGVEGTKMLEAKLGRSSYLDESATRGVPDPGAYGLLVLLQGMASA